MIAKWSLSKMILTLSLIIIIGILGSWTFENSYFDSLDFLLISYDKIAGLTMTIWQVQAVVVSISIALIAMTIGFSKDKVYGKNIMHFVFIEDKTFFHSKAELILILLILIFINYFFVAYEYLFGVVLILFISILGVMVLTYYTLSLLMSYEKVKEQVKINITEEFKQKLLIEVNNQRADEK